MANRMLQREIARLREQAEERRAQTDGSRAWLREQIGLIRERRASAPDDADRRAARQALAATAPDPEEAQRLRDLAEASGDPDDTRRAMLAHIRLIVARSERERRDARNHTTPRSHDPQISPTADTTDTDR